MKRIVLFLISFVMMLCVAAGCGGVKKTEGPKVLKVGTEVTFPPFEFREQGSKEISGFDIDLIRAIGKKLDMQIEILDMDFEALIPAVKRGNLNLVIAGMTITSDRQKIVDMSDPYYESGLCLVVSKGNTAIQKPEDLKGRAVAVQTGTTGEEKAKHLAGDKVRRFKTNEEVFGALKDKTAEAIIIDKPVAQYFINKHHPDAVIVGDAFEKESYGIVMRRHGELTPKVNKALAELKQSGEYDKIYEKWFGKETKPTVTAPVNTDGSKFIPMAQRTGNKSVVYFTRDLSAKGLQKIYEKVNGNITGKVAIKVHTGEKNGPNIIPRPWVKELIEKDIPGATVVETNTLYHGDRYTTEDHRETLKVNGWTFAPVDILDEEGTVMLPVKGGKYYKEMSMGSHITKYDSLVTLTHFKGHTMGGFGGSNKNLGIGIADGRIGKKMIHSGETGSQWGVTKDEFMERMVESTKATVDHFGKHITFINVLRNMSVDCDCFGSSAAPATAPDIGILASNDILAVDQASVDMVYALHGGKGHDLIERMESRHGLRQLTYMKELGMGNDLYEIVDLDK